MNDHGLIATAPTARADARGGEHVPTPPPDVALLGRVVGGYRLTSLIGQGGMGSVYLAEHTDRAKRAAVKIMRRAHSEDEVMVARFMNEARATKAIGHPNIIDILDVGRLEDGLPYLLMEYLEGETLAERLDRKGRLTLAEMLAIVAPAAQGLAAAHQQQIVHRDLKPENLFIVRGRQGEHVKVLDFGIAKLRGELSGVVHTGDALLGTPPYMSPEQCRGAPDQVGARSDVYALGTMIYEMLCGRVPFFSQSCAEVLVMQLSQAPTPPRELVPSLPPAVEAVILRALAKDPGTRFGGVDELMRALDRAVRDADKPAAGDLHHAPASRRTGATSVRRARSVTPGPTMVNSAAPPPMSDRDLKGVRRTRLVLAGSLTLLLLSVGSLFNSAPSSAPAVPAPHVIPLSAPAPAPIPAESPPPREGFVPPPVRAAAAPSPAPALSPPPARARPPIAPPRRAPTGAGARKVTRASRPPSLKRPAAPARPGPRPVAAPADAAMEMW